MEKKSFFAKYWGVGLVILVLGFAFYIWKYGITIQGLTIGGK